MADTSLEGFEAIDTFGLDPLFWGHGSELMHAIVQKNYPAIYSLLRKVTPPLPHSDCFPLCQAAIRSDCTLRAFQAILDVCPPAEELCSCFSFSAATREYTLLEQEAIRRDRCDILRLLLERDLCSDDAFPQLLENAVYCGSVACTHDLLQRSDAPLTFTLDFFLLWGMLGMNPEQDRCLRLIAQKMLHRPIPSEEEIPLPPGLTVRHAVFRDNWALINRICREGSVDRKDGEAVIRHILRQYDSPGEAEQAELLDNLFTACPALLRCQFPRYALAVTMLTGGSETQKRLRPHLDAMPGKQIHLFPDGPLEPCIDWIGRDGLLTHWDRVLGKEYTPVIKRNHRLCSSFFQQEGWDHALENLFCRCRVIGKPTSGKVSPLAKEILSHASPGLVARLLQTNGVLAAEDFVAMLEWCTDIHQLTSRAAILAYGKKEVHYEL